MPQARVWTAPADAAIVLLREQGKSWALIGRNLGLSRNTVIERGRRIKAAAPVRVSVAKPVPDDLDDPNRPALPAGHRLTWGLLTDEPYPEGNDR